MLRGQIHNLLHPSRPFMQSQPTVIRHASSRPTLPRLPVPDLRLTLQRYLVSIEPLLREDAERGGPAFEPALEQRRRWVEDFENGLGKLCQERLHQLDKASPHNWLDDNFWLKKAYHEWRAPLVINSNWWLSFVNDPSVPLDVQLGHNSRALIGNTGLTRWQIRRAALLVHRVLEFKAQLDRQEIYPDTTRAGIWFRRTTSHIFNRSRLPRPSCDVFSTPPSASDRSSRTILLCVHDWFYAVDVLDDSFQPLPVRELEKRILGIVADVHRRLSEGASAVPISVLGADDRDQWASNLDYLLHLSLRNRKTLSSINHSLIALSLDPYTYVRPSHSATSEYPLLQPDAPDEVDDHLHNLRSSHPERPARNRWWDKPFNLIVESNARAGAIGEHSPCDALVPSIVAEYAVVQGIDDTMFGGPIDLTEPHFSSSNVDMASWRRLDWDTDAYIEAQCIEAEKRIKCLVNNSDDGAMWFNAYGTSWIKEFARQSPDAYVQMAMQLAWYRTRGTFTATYETALTRLFHHGRTETIRTLSNDSRAFVLGMDNSSLTTEERRKLLERAIQTHTNLTRAASTGKGIDRHLLGLRLVLRSELGEDHPLFSDELFSRSQTWKLSTSGLSAGHQFRGTGFGASEADGYGINYLAGPDVIKFGIESKHSSPLTSTQLFKDAITQALLDMRLLFLVPRANM
ncbi:acyltransferase ChoActase/COT/CPT [Cristinia sonorae]|uniref:Acyltransferase ChoActase/COT/CPT n=1 Tax=Cristinia sonorae TaxID=1940300 RepID=A0A8K0UMH8_9AGAR|nr:acyltransferase ChoActase/COT/CPT [Cristinia sonorae]